ncbi:MAG: CynX/NimT family MFS transporter [Clostridia bacterium]
MTDWRAVWVIFAGGLAAGATITKVPPALPAIRADLGLGLVQSGFVHTMMYVIGGCLGVFGGTLADRFGQKRVALAGLVFMAVGSLGGAFSGDAAALLAARFVEGLGFILFTVSAVPLLVGAAKPDDRGTALSLWSCYMPTGGTIALLLAPVALATFGWRSLWMVLAAYAAGCAALLARCVPAPRFGGAVDPLRLLRESLPRPGILALCLAFTCYTGQWTSLMTWLPTFVVEERGMSQPAAALVAAAFVAINIPGNLLGGLLLRLGLRRWAAMAAGAVAMGLTAAIGFSNAVPDAGRFAALLAFSLLGGIIPGVIFSGAPVHARSPEHIGTTNGMIMQASHIAQFSVPILVAWVASRSGSWTASLATMLVLAALGVVAALMIRSAEARR